MHHAVMPIAQGRNRRCRMRMVVASWHKYLRPIKCLCRRMPGKSSRSMRCNQWVVVVSVALQHLRADNGHGAVGANCEAVGDVQQGATTLGDLATLGDHASRSTAGVGQLLGEATLAPVGIMTEFFTTPCLDQAQNLGCGRRGGRTSAGHHVRRYRSAGEHLNARGVDEDFELGAGQGARSQPRCHSLNASAGRSARCVLVRRIARMTLLDAERR